MSKSVDMRAWHYFLGLEKQLAETADFVEPHKNNRSTFSDRYAGLLLLIGSEVDVLAKELSKKICPNFNVTKHTKLVECCKIITEQYPLIHEVKVDIERYSLSFQPWEGWQAPATAPDWWGSYNSVKHDRLAAREQASQLNVFKSICGLLILNMYLYGNDVYLFPQPTLLNSGFPVTYVSKPEKFLPGLEDTP